MASLINLDKNSLEGYYSSEMKSQSLSSAFANGNIINDVLESGCNLFLTVIKTSKTEAKVEFQVPSYLAKVAVRVGLRPRSWKSSAQQTIVPEGGKNTYTHCRTCLTLLLIDMRKALELFCGPDSDDQPCDFSAPCQPRCTDFKQCNSHCKEAHKIILTGKGGSLDLFSFDSVHKVKT